MLFLIYINDLIECFKFSKILLYADDLKIFKVILIVRDCIELQKDLDPLAKYYEYKKMKLNISKCASFSFTRKISSIEFQYYLNDEPIKRVSQVKDMGVIFDSKLSFNRHADYIINSCNRSLGFFCRMCRDFNDETAIKVVYYFFVYSKLNFASVVWTTQYNCNELRLERVQNRFLMFLHFELTGIYVTMGNSRIRSLYHLRTLEQRRILIDLIFVYEILMNYYDCPELSTDRLSYP